MDDFISLSNRLLNRAPAIGIVLAQQFVNDSWQTLQARREWSFRRRFSTFAPPTLNVQGTASTNVAGGAPTLITGQNTAWDQSFVGRQIRLGGLLYPYYTIVGVLTPTSLLIDQPWSGPDVSAQALQILQVYYPVPTDFGYFYSVVSIKDSYQLWTNVTEGDLAYMDPQRTNFGQTYAVSFRDYSPQYGGVIGPVIPCTNPLNPAPVSTTSNGYTYVANATYIIQVVVGGATGTATWQWLRAGMTSFQPPQPTSDQAIYMADGVQIYWPDDVAYVAGDIFVINCVSRVSEATPRYELWPAPTFAGYLYPYIYIAKEYSLSVNKPQLPPFIANRGEVLLEMALEKCAEYPGSDGDHPNPYHDLRQAEYHARKVERMLVDLERNDEEVGVSLVDYQNFPMYSSPWLTGRWQQSHAPFLS